MANRIVITGVQGFVGRYLTADWLVADPQVTIIGVGRSDRLDEHFTHDVRWGDSTVRASLPATLADGLSSDRYRYVKLDLADTASLTRLLVDVRPSIVVHLAGALRDDPPTSLVRANIGAVASLFEAIAAAKQCSARIVLGSSGSVYGHIPGRVPPFHEDAACAPIDPYAVSKWAAETLSRILADTHGMQVLRARIFNLVGPGQDERHLCGWLGRQVAAIAEGLLSPVISVGPLDTTRDFIDVRDTATALRLMAVEGEPRTIYNVASGRETSVQQVLNTLLDLTHLRDQVRVERKPGRPAEVLRHYADVERLHSLGYAPKYSLSDSLADVLQYYRERVAKKTVGSCPR